MLLEPHATSTGPAHVPSYTAMRMSVIDPQVLATIAPLRSPS
jgi:hypothetical protein